MRTGLIWLNQRESDKKLLTGARGFYLLFIHTINALFINSRPISKNLITIPLAIYIGDML